jgi:hypothetical protein
MGRVWFAKFAEAEWGLYPDQQKYRYIAHVLSLCNGHPKAQDSEHSIYNADLYAKVSGKETGSESHADGETTRPLSTSDLGDKLSQEDINGFRKVGNDLLDQLHEAKEAGNPTHVKKVQENIDLYRSHPFNQYGIKTVISKDEKSISFRVLYRASAEVEKLRQLVKHQIRKATEDFDRMPRFQSHLQHSFKMKSNKTFYSPESPTSWYVSM